MARTFWHWLQIAEISTTRIRSFREVHELGVPARLTVDARFDEYIELELFLGQPANLTFGYEEEDRHHSFAGIIETARVVGNAEASTQTGSAAGYRYVLEIVSVMALLAGDFGCGVFQDLTVPDVIKKFIEDLGLPPDSFEFRLTGTYQPRDWCVRYQESALAFISRLCEHEGIYFFSKVDDAGSEKVVFADDSTAAAPIDGDDTLLLRVGSRMLHDMDVITAIRERSRVVSGKYVLRDFDFERPSLDLTAEAEADKDASLEVYDYPGGYFDPAEGMRLARARLEAEQVRREEVEIQADCARICIARSLQIAESLAADGAYFTTRVVYEFEANREQADHPDEATDRFDVAATLLPLRTVFRPRLQTPLPIIPGPQTAIVVAPEGSPAEEIHTDEHGRCKVKFHWDLSDATDDKASAWFRTTQLQTSGSMLLPRIGWEVIVEFLEGNPDRPVVTGRLYDGLFMPPYALPEGKTRTALGTNSTPGGGGRNEIRFEDKAGAEEIMIHAQYDMTLATANNKTKTIGNNETLNIGNNSTLEVGGAEDTKITKGSKSEIGADQTVSVGGNRKVEVNAVNGLNVSGSSTNTVSGDQQSMVGNPLEALLALAAAKAAEFASAKAGEALAAIDSAVQSRIDQAMGPINSLASQAQSLGNGMQSLAGGDLSATGSLLGAAGAIPSATAMTSGLAATNAAPGVGSSAASVSASSMLGGAVQSAIQRSAAAGANALGSALGLDSGEGGGQSGANVAGPEGNVDGVDETDRTKGPGHTVYKVAGSHTETVGSLKALLALNGINTNVNGTMTQDIGAARVSLIIKDWAESVEGVKSEKALGLVVATKGGESEQVGGAKMSMVGGAVVDLLKGSHVVSAGAPATFVGAFHKLEAKTAIVIKCGASEVVIDSSGISIQSPLISVTAGKIQLPKAVRELV